MMRLWHKELINVLPRNQLIAQWRELCAIVGKLDKCGTPNHILVNKILDYPPLHFMLYTNAVIDEMNRRGYKVSKRALDNMTVTFNRCKHLFSLYYYQYVPNDFHDVYRDWHSDRYFMQCYYNLQEKFDCHGITGKEWVLIVERKGEYYDRKMA